VSIQLIDMEYQEMMSKTSKTEINLLMVLLFFCIALLFINTLFPWLAVSQNAGLADKQYFNLETMENSEDEIIKDYAGRIGLMNYLLWSLIVISLLSLLGITYYSFYNLPKIFQYAMTICGIAVLIISIIIINIDYTLITYFDETSAISPAALISHLNFSHFSIIFLAFMLIITIFYAKIQIEKFLFKTKKSKRNILMKKDIQKFQTEKQIIEPDVETNNNKRSEVEDWLVGEIKDIDEKTQENKIEQFWEQNKEKNISDQDKSFEEDDLLKNVDKNKYQEINFEKKSFQEPFPKEKPKEKYTSDDLKISNSFEKALASAIEKKQSQLKQIKPINEKIESKKLDNKDIKNDDIKQEYKQKPLMVRCPQCTHIFSSEKKEGQTKIKCPRMR
jgi:hypothetical protein